ncbi:SMP-30/gluconolactonase/LRE family protein [bacterium]|nr:SMP-30/gluconolactonase/LRE family protein [bacterium]
MSATLTELLGSAPQVEHLATGFQFTEGPVWIPATGDLLFSDIPASRIYCWHGGKAQVWREPSRQANGNTLDPRGRLLTCEHATRRVSRTEPDGTVTVLADRFAGRRLNSPNDIKCRRDGLVYFTDPPYGVKPEERELDVQGVFRLLDGSPSDLKPSGADPLPEAARPGLSLVTDDFIKPNGLCFSPDERLLYVADTERSHVRVFEVAADGTLGGGAEFCGVDRPDGMETDAAGNLYVAGMTGLVCFGPDGRPLGELPLPERPANLEFGGTDGRTLFLTARTSLYRLVTTIPGAAWS